MNNLLFLSFFIAIINYCSCATFINPHASHKDHPDKCYDVETNHIFSPGETYRPIGRCMVLRCASAGQVDGYTCGKVSMPDICTELGQDLTKPHPFCCESFLCPDKNGKPSIYNPSVPVQYNEIINEENDNYL